jgi:hypothetical protein
VSGFSHILWCCRAEHCEACGRDFSRFDFDAHECKPKCVCGERIDREQWDEHQLYGTQRSILQNLFAHLLISTLNSQRAPCARPLVRSVIYRFRPKSKTRTCSAAAAALSPVLHAVDSFDFATCNNMRTRAAHTLRCRPSLRLHQVPFFRLLHVFATDILIRSSIIQCWMCRWSR